MISIHSRASRRTFDNCRLLLLPFSVAYSKCIDFNYVRYLSRRHQLNHVRFRQLFRNRNGILIFRYVLYNLIFSFSRETDAPPLGPLVFTLFLISRSRKILLIKKRERIRTRRLMKYCRTQNESSPYSVTTRKPNAMDDDDTKPAEPIGIKIETTGNVDDGAP